MSIGDPSGAGEAPASVPAMAPESPLGPLADLAREAALAAGTLIRAAGRGVAPEEKATHDYVTAVDRAAEEAMTSGMLRRRSRRPSPS